MSYRFEHTLNLALVPGGCQADPREGRRAPADAGGDGRRRRRPGARRSSSGSLVPMADNTNLEAPVTSVTVFRDGARVVRRGVVSLSPGPASIEVAGLPATVDPASVRVVARGTDLALLEVEVQRGYRADPLRQDVGRLRDEMERCRDVVSALDDEDSAVEARLAFLRHLSEAAATAFSRAVGFGRLERSELPGMADQLAAGTAAALASRREIAARRRVARRDLEVAEQSFELAESGDGDAVELVGVAATLEVTAETEGEIEVSYHVSDASWRPLYDLRLDGPRLAVSYLAEVTQRSGEDWPAAELTLSTVRRARHQAIPELPPWYVGRPVRAPAQAMGSAPQGWGAPGAPGQAMAGDSQAPVYLPAASRAFAAAAPIVADSSESGAALVYRVQRPLPVPSDGRPHKTMVARFELDAALDHVTVPALAPEAYLRATVTNSTEVLLLPGPANVFHGAEYVGATALETVAPGEEFELQLGVDDRIRVERDLRRRSTSKAILGGTRSIEVAYEISVQNHRGEPARVRVQDHVPVSRDGDIKVRLREVSPKPAEQDDLGVLSWDLALEPGAESVIKFAFTVEHPSSTPVVGL